VTVMISDSVDRRPNFLIITFWLHVSGTALCWPFNPHVYFLNCAFLLKIYCFLGLDGLMNE